MRDLSTTSKARSTERMQEKDPAYTKVTVAGAPCHKSCCTLVMFCVIPRLQVPPLRAVDETSSIQKMQIGSCSSTSVHHGIRCCTYTSHMGSGLEMVQVQVEAQVSLPSPGTLPDPVSRTRSRCESFECSPIRPICFPTNSLPSSTVKCIRLPGLHDLDSCHTCLSVCLYHTTQMGRSHPPQQTQAHCSMHSPNRCYYHVEPDDVR